MSNARTIGIKTFALLISLSLVFSMFAATFTVKADTVSTDYAYSIDGSGNATITGYSGSGGNITIPSSIGIYPVTSISNYAFYDCKLLTSATIPDGVTSIGDYAFENCNLLISVTIPDSVTNIGTWAFQSCWRLANVTLPNGITSIGADTFAGCSITSIAIPSGVTSIGDFAFEDCSTLASVSIPSSVTSIGNDAFYGCLSLTSITIPSSVTSIGNYAFYSPSQSFKGILGTPGSYAQTYANNSGIPFFDSSASYTVTFDTNDGTLISSQTVSPLTIVSAPTSSLPTKTDYTLSGWTPSNGSSATIGIPYTATGNMTFYPVWTSVKYRVSFNTNGGSTISSLLAGYNTTISASVTPTRTGYAFYGWFHDSACTQPWNFATDTITGDTTLYADWLASDYKITVDKNGNATITGYTGSGGDITIPSTIGNYPVVGIGTDAFFNCTSLKSVTIPSSVTSIGDYAFYDCSALTSVTIPNNITSIGFSAFSSCTSLTSFTIPSGVTSLGSDAFYDCSSLTSVTIPSSVTSIGGGAFFDCSSLTSVTIPSGVTGIGTNTFSNCSSLTNVTIPNSVTSIGVGAFNDCSSITRLTIPSSVTNIGFAAFESCTSLTSVTILSSVTSIGDYAFDGCTSLSNVTIQDGATGFNSWTFGDCTSLKSIILPNSVKVIGMCMFDGCTSLSNITIPSSVTSIGEGAFYGCSTLTSINIPSSVTSIVNDAFKYCSALEAIVGTTGSYAQTYANNNNISFCDSTASYTVSFDTNDGSVISTQSVNPLNAISAPTSSLPTKTGYVICGWTTSNGSSTAVRLPYNVTGNITFYPILALISYTVTFNTNGGSTQKSISAGYNTTVLAPTPPVNSGYSFDGWYHDSACTQPWIFSTDTITANTTIYAGWIISPYAFTLDNNGNATITGYTGLGGSITIPSSIGGHTVVAIGDNAFNNFGSLLFVIIPSSVISIGNAAFENCSSLKSITIPDSVTSIGNYVFDGCTYLKNVTLPVKITEIGDYTFDGCSALSAITIPAGVTRIGDSAFYDCSTLKAITIPVGVTSIGVAAFFDCWLFRAITIPTSVTSIGNSAFQNCANISTISIPSGVKSIGDGMFSYCLGLSSVTIPSSVTSIGDSSFANCISLASIIIPDSVTSIGDSAFDSCTALVGITIPDSVTSLAKTAFSHCESLEYIYGDSDSFDNSVKQFAQTSGLKFFDMSKTLSVNFNSLGGSKVKSQNVDPLVRISAPTAPTKAGYTFNGWYISKSGGLKLNFPYTVETSVTLYAQWTISNHAVTFSTNGGSPFSSVAITNNIIIFSPAAPTKAGYVFTGWYITTNGAKASFPYTLKSNVSFYAVWASFSSQTTTGAKASKTSSTSDKITWNSINGSSGYTVYRATSANGSYSLITSLNSTSYTNAGLTKGRTYYYKVKAYCTVNGKKVYSGSSAVVKVKM